MSEDKLRALLAEARKLKDSVEMWHGPKTYERAVALFDRIDAALAEPVDDYDVDADLRLHKEDRLRLRAENLRLERERDEARAEVARLIYAAGETIASATISTYGDGWRAGVEAMREAAASCVGSDTALLQTYRSVLERRIRALPIPEDKP